jgi:flavin reductase ActVB
MISQETFKHIMAHLTGAVTVITTCDKDGQPWGFTATSFCSLSLDPPLVLCCLNQDADCYEAFITGYGFAINVLSDQQRHLSQRFATKGRLKYQATHFLAGQAGLPLLPGALVTLECKLQQIYPGGDHAILIGLVEHGAVAERELGVRPLLHYARAYGTFADLAEET